MAGCFWPGAGPPRAPGTLHPETPALPGRPPHPQPGPGTRAWLCGWARPGVRPAARRCPESRPHGCKRRGSGDGERRGAPGVGPRPLPKPLPPAPPLPRLRFPDNVGQTLRSPQPGQEGRGAWCEGVRRTSVRSLESWPSTRLAPPLSSCAPWRGRAMSLPQPQFPHLRSRRPSGLCLGSQVLPRKVLATEEASCVKGTLRT